jgi:hypothetical protein
VIHITQGVPVAIKDTFDNYADAAALHPAAYGQGHVYQMVEVGGMYDRYAVPPSLSGLSLGTSSIWGKVSDIDNLAAQWSG